MTGMKIAFSGALAAAVVALPAGASGDPRCDPAGSRTLALSDEVRVYRLPGRLGDVVACRRATATTRNLDYKTSSYAFPRVALAGSVVAWALDVSDADQRPGFTRVIVADLSLEPPASDHLAATRAGFTQFAKLGSIVVRRSGGVAWIACRSDDWSRGDARPSCVRRGGGVKWVFKMDAGAGRRTVLARGRAIDPASLRLRGSRIAWTEGARRRRAVLR